jgi:tetratricopeptide (TPR) repeat protein
LALGDAWQHLAAGEYSTASMRLAELVSPGASGRAIVAERIHVAALFTTALLRSERAEEARRAGSDVYDQINSSAQRSFLAEPEGILLLALGQAEFEAHDFEAALVRLESALALLRREHVMQSPWRAKAEALRGLCLLRLGHREEAAAALTRISNTLAPNTRLADHLDEPIRSLRRQLLQLH